MSRIHRRGERAESMIEVAGMLALTVAVLAAIAWVLIGKPGQAQTPNLTPEQQAYVVSVATQQADAYIRAVATQQAEAPAAPVPPRAPAAPPPAAPPPTPIPASNPPPAPNPTISPPPPAPALPTPASYPTIAPPPPPPEPAKPPMATCVGFMVGVTATGIEACQGIISDTAYDVRVRNCIYDIVTGNGMTATGKNHCVQAAVADRELSDCFLGLVGESHFGRQSCYVYYRSH